MLSEWINRVGLIFDFTVGFLLAPEIIGKRRLEMLEQRINLAFSYFTESTEEVEEIYQDWRYSRYHIPWPRRFPILGRLINRRLGKRHYPASRFHVVVCLITAFATFFLADRVFVRILGSNLLVDLWLHRYPVNYDFTDSVIYGLLALGWTIFGTLASYALEYWILWFSRLVVAKLRGEDRLREIMLGPRNTVIHSGFSAPIHSNILI
jgi:hypothetical protein